MSQTKLLALVVAAVLALAGGWYFGTATRPAQKAAIDTGRPMFPDLAPRLKDARRVEILTKGKTTEIALKDGVWGLVDRGGYRVQETKMRGMLTALTELRLVEPRTSDPAEFARLGLEDPETVKDGTATLLRVEDEAGKPILALIAGHRRSRTQGNVPDQIYVRLPGDTHTWIAEGGLQVDADPQVWLDRDVMNISSTRIGKVVSTRGTDTIELDRDGDKLKLARPAEHPKLEDYKLDDVMRGLESLTFQDVKPDSAPIGDPAGQAVFDTLDGLEIRVSVNHLDKDSWTRFSVVPLDKDKDYPDVARLNAKLGGWAFQTGPWKDKALIPSLADLSAPPPKVEVPTAAAPKQ